MSRKRHHSEIGFGSDSFLDIIANIVGILIILIVVAGVRIGQAPFSSEEADEFEATVAAAIDPLREPEDEPLPIPDIVVGTSDAPTWEPTAAEPIVIEQWREHAPTELARHARQQTEREQLQRQLERLQNLPSEPSEDTRFDPDRLTKSLARLELLNQQLLRSRETHTAVRAEVDGSQQQLAAVTQRLEDLNRQLMAAEAKLSQSEYGKAKPVVLRHDATPISEEVKSHEIHFVIQRGKVAEIPLDALLEQVREQIERRKDWILRSNKHHGVAGPIRGFKLDYLVERQTLSTLDQLRVGTGLIRIGLTKWTIERDPDTMIEENLEQATGSTSRFLALVRSAPADAACTFWVYPDSFTEYQRLKQLAHDSGLRVAGRPLPEGIPIGGSPQGSRSAVQ
jgi:hypothetical protein